MTLKEFFATIRKIETGGKFGETKINRSIGDNGEALGPLQIHAGYYKDATGIVPDDYEDVVANDAACLTMLLYLWRYDRTRLLAVELPTDAPVRWARIHNGGPRGNSKKATEAYAQRFIEAARAEGLL